MSKFKSSVVLLVAFTFSLILFQQCKHDSVEMQDPVGDTPTDTILDVPITLSDTCNFDTVYFQNDILPIFLANCAVPGCHNASTAADQVVLDNYDDVMKTAKIKAFKGDDNDLMEVIMEMDPAETVMPPAPASRLSPELINAIRIWINQGALNNECENKCKTENITFSQEIWPILESTCRGCHQGARAAKGIRITNYTQVKSMVDDGSLEGTVYHLGGYSPMPPGGQVDSCSMQKLRIWIEEGALDN